MNLSIAESILYANQGLKDYFNKKMSKTYFFLISTEGKER